MRIAVKILLLVGCFWSLPSVRCQAEAVQVMPLSEVKPGMTGITLTVLSGTEPDSLPIKVLSVMPANSPGRHTIIVQGYGELSHTGIASGMSGSPVYVEGKLIGALAFAFNGAIEAIGGVTPFEEMAYALDEYLARSATPRSTAPETGSGSFQPLISFPEWRSMSANGQTPTRSLRQTLDNISPEPAENRGDIPELMPIRLPLRLENGSPAILSALQRQLGLVGLQTVPALSEGGTGSTVEVSDEILKPGDAMSVNLITGDMAAAVIGTVTWVDDDKVIAFGHPFMATGTSDLPIGRAWIHAVIPNRNVSFKLGSPINELGSLIADREPGVAARMGIRAPTIPLDLVLTTSEPGNWQKSFHFDVARDVVLTPTLLAAAVSSAMSEQAFSLGLSTLKSRVDIILDSGETVSRDDLFRTLNPPQTIAAQVLAGVNYLISSNFRSFPVKSISIQLDLKPQLDVSEIDRLHVDRLQYRPGETIKVDINLRRHLGEFYSKKVELKVPENVLGTELMVMVGSANAFHIWDQERAPEKYRPRSFDDLVRLIEEYPSDEDLIIRLFGAARGVVMRGQEISSLPLSKWRVLNSGVAGGVILPTGGIILDEVIIKTGEVVLGGNYVRVEIEK